MEEELCIVGNAMLSFCSLYTRDEYRQLYHGKSVNPTTCF